jgi:CRISPR-associated endoribonuclease cas2
MIMSTEYIGLIMYDLPMQTDDEILRYKNFRKKLIEKGYYQLQKSVYIIRSKTKEKIELAEKQLSILAPENSSIRSIILTDEQFQKMKIISGEATMGEKISNSKILEF